MCKTQAGTAGAADTHAGAATGSLSRMEVRRRASSLQRVTIQWPPATHHFSPWTWRGRAQRGTLRNDAPPHTSVDGEENEDAEK